MNPTRNVIYKAVLSSNTTYSQVESSLSALLSPSQPSSNSPSNGAHVPERQPWTLTSDNQGLERHFVFPTFKLTRVFLSQVMELAGEKRHHPEWSNVYNKVYVRWTTHRPRGLSFKDVECAERSDAIAKEVGEVLSELKGSGADDIMRKLADTVTGET